MMLKEAMDKKTRFTLMQTAQSGHGKTSRALTATRFGKVFIFDFDGKATGAARKLPEALAKDVPANWQELVELETFRDKPVDQAVSKLKEFIALGSKLPYSTVVVDTYTLLNDKYYEVVMGKKLETGGKAERDEWGQINSKLTNFFNLLFQLPCNLILNCHVAEAEDDVTKKTKYGQAGRGGHRFTLPGLFSDSNYMFMENGKYKIRLKNSDTYPVNTNLPEKFIDANGLAVTASLSIFDDYAYRKGV